MKIRLCLLIVLTLSCGTLIFGQSTKRRVNPKKTVQPVESVAPNKCDTITDIALINNTISVSGYKKPVASRVETLMLTNKSESDTIRALEVDIDYRTPDGAQLNRRSVVFESVIPPGETRHCSAPAWDRQQLFYYIGTPPARKTQRTSPYDISIKPLKLIISK